MNPAVLVAPLLLVTLFVTGCAPVVGTVTTSVRPSSPDQSQQVQDRAITALSTSVTVDFVARVVGDNEDVWDSLFQTMGHPPYTKSIVVIFSGGTPSLCGIIRTSVGPFYCEHDRKIYIDTAYFSNPSRHFDAGNFAPAFLIAHEFARHIQNVLGRTPQTDAAMPQKKELHQQMPVILELQADCYAGVWTHFVERRNLLEPGDLEQGLPAAFSVSDPLTKGPAAERLRWFRQGFATGDPRQCDTTKAALQ